MKWDECPAKYGAKLQFTFRLWSRVGGGQMYMREGCKRRLAQKLQVEKMTTNRKQIRPTQPYPVWTLIFSETSEILVIRSSITNHTICAHVFLGRHLWKLRLPLRHRIKWCRKTRNMKTAWLRGNGEAETTKIWLRQREWGRRNQQSTTRHAEISISWASTR